MTHAMVTWGDKTMLEAYNTIKGLSHYQPRFHSNRADREEQHAFFGVISILTSLLNISATAGPLKKCRAKDPKQRFRSVDISCIESKELISQYNAVKNLTYKDFGVKEVPLLDLAISMLNSPKVPTLQIVFFGTEGSRELAVGEYRYLIKRLLIPLYNETLKWWRIYKTQL